MFANFAKLSTVDRLGGRLIILFGRQIILNYDTRRKARRITNDTLPPTGSLATINRPLEWAAFHLGDVHV